MMPKKNAARRNPGGVFFGRFCNREACRKRSGTLGKFQIALKKTEVLGKIFLKILIIQKFWDKIY